MKILFSILALSVIAFVGCKTVDGEKQLDSQKVAAVAYSAAAVGTEAALMQHPEWLPQFQLAADDLAALEGNGTINVDSILEIISRLPVKELKSENAQLAINGARILIGAAGYSTVEADKLKELQPVVSAIRAGIQEGITSRKNKGL